MFLNKVVWLICFFALPTVVGMLAVHYFLDLDTLKSVGSNAHVITFLYSIPAGYSYVVLNSLKGLIGHKSLGSDKNLALGKIVMKEQAKIHRLIVFYVVSALATAIWKILSGFSELTDVSYFLGVYSVTLLTMSILTMYKLRHWDMQATQLLTRFSTDEKEAEEKSRAEERKQKILDDLNKDCEFSQEEKEHFERVRKELIE